MKKLNLLLFTVLIFGIYSCEPRGQRTDEVTINETDEETDRNVNEWERGGIKVIKLEHGHLERNARIEQRMPQDNAVITGRTNVNFEFDVNNFNLGESTPDANERGMADAHHGQHIHNILNNQPYTAHYENTFSKDLQPGHYVSLSFLSRSYHESLKENNAYVLTEFTVGGGEQHQFDRNAPHMFYSRPKDDYKGDETRRILLDFYLVNVDLSENGHKVRATINGNEFILTDWVPYGVEGLPMGTATFRLELLDADGNIVPGPFNTVERTINLTEN